MKYNVDDLNPSNPILIINEKEYSLNLLTLQIDILFKTKIDRLENIFIEINKRPILLFELIWLLLKDKSNFDYSPKKFKDAIFSELSTVEMTKSMMKNLSEVINKSMPIGMNTKNSDELRKINNLQNDDDGKPCYGVYYDTVAKRYGYTIEQFYNLTLRQLHILLIVIGDKSYDELEVQASLQGKKLRPRMKPLENTVESDTKLDDDAKELHERLMKEYKEKQGKL